MTPLANGKAYLALKTTTKSPRGTRLFSVLLFASLAILTPLASARRCGYEPRDLIFGSRDNDSPFRRAVIDQGLVYCGPDAPGGAMLNAFGGTNESPTIPRLAEDSTTHPSVEKLPRSKPSDFNQDIYQRNKLEFSLDVGWFPINIPFPFDVFEGDPYDLYPLRYTLVPLVASLRWQVDDVGSPWILRGNWDVTFSGSYTAIPKGAETRYFSYDMGLRRNFVQRNWRVVPYVDLRAGLGLIDAKGPLGVYYAQGQDFTFTINLGSGARYNFNSRYAISAGLNWMHISNNNLSAPQYSNYGINVYGPMFGLDITLRKPAWHSQQ